MVVFLSNDKVGKFNFVVYMLIATADTNREIFYEIQHKLPVSICIVE